MMLLLGIGMAMSLIGKMESNRIRERFYLQETLCTDPALKPRKEMYFVSALWPLNSSPGVTRKILKESSSATKLALTFSLSSLKSSLTSSGVSERKLTDSPHPAPWSIVAKYFPPSLVIFNTASPFSSMA